MRQQSKKRRAETAERKRIVGLAFARDNWQCVARELVPEVECWGPLDPDERIARSLWPGGHLVLENVQSLCRGHHDWKHAHPAESIERGLSAHSWDRPSSS